MSTFKVTLEGDGISVEKEISQSIALSILNVILSANENSVSLGQLISPTTMEELASPSLISAGVRSNKPISLREFINEKSPTTNAELIVSIAQFISTHESSEDFNRDDIRLRFSSAGEPLPKNFTRDFQTAIDKGWIGEHVGSKGRYYVTRTGESLVSNSFTKGKE